MPPLKEFIASQIKAMQPSAGRPPKPVTCLRVKRVAVQSIAGHAGVAAGDLLVYLDGGPASKSDPKLYKHRANKRLYTFFSPARAEQIELACTGIEIGVDLVHTSEATKARYKPADSDVSALAELWEDRAHQTLLDLSTATLAIPARKESPALMFEGAAMWEAGRHHDGMTRIDAYLRQYAANWTTIFAAIGMYYQGLELIRTGDADAGLERLQQSFACEALGRTAEAIEKITGQRPPMRTAKWAGQRWPAQYKLPLLEDGPGHVSISDTLAAMDDEKLLVVCLLATYRSNGPYWEFLQRWVNFATWFAPYLHGLHVITAEPKRYPNHGWIYQVEDAAKQIAAPAFKLLLDEGGGQAHAPLEVDRSPSVFVLNRQGTIVYEGDLEPVDLWDTLAVKAGSL